ncbi:5-oxoprolinase subunit PxpB [Arthrospiribacter ruber]|uniref:5-oxoprolinase subunit PxpB n=1 Tax=Arthrospiribacter ruber TaxID=2487934 RepID=A0A951IXX9_9BACT|nr:5-oxoprolinase subunit PxpB [Arthrospiribacter ruber]MBW3468154.1 5-oxoprolinase subunit PxpB [Arthrospiribacter ruber]
MNIHIKHIHQKLVEIFWQKEISPKILHEMIVTKSFLENQYADGIKEIRMGYHSLSLKLSLDMSKQDAEELLEEIQNIKLDQTAFSSKTWTLPVCYSKEMGKDLESLSKLHQMEIEEIISRHSTPEYLLYFYGFIPGFMYLGGLDDTLFTPRKSNPDRAIAAGSVAIGGYQTGIYPNESPGGWHVIGNCPLPLFDIHQHPPVMPQVGDKVRFRSVEIIEYEEIKAMVNKGEFNWSHD